MTHRKAFLCLHHIPIYDGNEQLLSLKVGQRETEPSRHHYPGSFTGNGALGFTTSPGFTEVRKKFMMKTIRVNCRNIFHAALIKEPFIISSLNILLSLKSNY